MDVQDDEPQGAQDDLEAIRPRWSAGKTAALTFVLGGVAAGVAHWMGPPQHVSWTIGDAATMENEVRIVDEGLIDDLLETKAEPSARPIAGSGQRHRGEEGRMGRPMAKNKSGSYAMKGPSGSSYGVGGLGLVGTGRGGGQGSAEDGSDPFARTSNAGEGYASAAEQPFVSATDDPLSTFSIDVDTASYSNSRRLLREGHIPPPSSVRVEEYVNYFDYDYAPPTDDTPFAVSAEVGPCPWSGAHKLVQIGLQGRIVEQADVPARNLVFLLDVSGSMASPDKLPLLVRSLSLLVDQLRAQDRVGIVVYAGASGVVLEPTTGDRRGEIEAALQRLGSGGSTNGGAGIELAYRLAQRHFVDGGINRVILATDGDFNVGIESQTDLQALIEAKRDSGVFLSVLGFGTGNLQDDTMELLADKGNGNYAYIDSDVEARKVLVTEVGGTLVTIAKDVKIQVDFDPTHVASWRLVGYDNRRLAHEDFANDTKDAGEIGAGHSVTALYEIVPTRTAETSAGTLMTLALRYKQPDSNRSTRMEVTVHDRDRTLASTSDDFRFAAAVTEMGLLLRRSEHAGTASWPHLVELAAGARGEDVGCLRGDFVQLAQDAARLSGVEVEPVATCSS